MGFGGELSSQSRCVSGYPLQTMEAIMRRLRHTQAKNVLKQTVQGGIPLSERKVHRVGMRWESKKKAAILTAGAGLVAVLLLAFTLYGLCRSEEMLKDLLGFTKY